MQKDKESAVRSDDTVVETEVAEGLTGELESLYPSRSTKTEITHAWSGIYCVSSDGKPLVGAIKELPKQYMSLGYTG